MRVDIDFSVNAPLEKAWPALNDIGLIASCVPTCELLAVESQRIHHLKISPNFGMISATYAGTLTIVARDDLVRISRFLVDARQSNGLARAKGRVRMRAFERAGVTMVKFHADVHLQGLLALAPESVVVSLGQTLLREFAKRLEAKL
jgi:carbon monoxide dehydrogenase subunit G